MTVYVSMRDEKTEEEEEEEEDGGEGGEEEVEEDKGGLFNVQLPKHMSSLLLSKKTRCPILCSMTRGSVFF